VALVDTSLSRETTVGFARRSVGCCAARAPGQLPGLRAGECGWTTR